MIKRKKRYQNGFTLIEVMVVLVIVAMMGAVVAVNVFGQLESAKVKKAKSDINAFSQALELYRLDNFQYPNDLQELVPKYVKKIEKDPWNNDYVYVPSGQGGFNVYSLGKDGAQGGGGDNADIGL